MNPNRSIQIAQIVRKNSEFKEILKNQVFSLKSREFEKIEMTYK